MGWGGVCVCLYRTRPRVLAGVPRQQAGSEGLEASPRAGKAEWSRGDRFESALRLLRETVKRRLLPELGLKNF